MEIEQICKFMPKVELHAHLNGSITDEILIKLNLISNNKKGNDQNLNLNPIPQTTDLENNMISTNDQKPEIVHPADNKQRTLTECWVAFQRIHEFITTPELLYMATCEVIADFNRDNVIYLEIRTAPKKCHQITSKSIYIETIINAIRDCREKYPIIVKLFISIDRKLGFSEGVENVQLASKWNLAHPDILVGLDLSGDPNYGTFHWIIPLLENEVRKSGLPISLHLSEIINIEETEKFLQFKPDRMAHGHFLHPSNGGTNHLWQMAKSSKIPIEACITSNLITGVCPSIDKHYVKQLQEEDLPYAICTDDSGVFKTSLSKEYQKLLQIIPMNLEQLKELSVRTVSFTFTTQKEKSDLKNQIINWWNKNVSQL